MYFPGGSDVRLNRPSASVTAERVPWRFGLFASTVTPGSAVCDVSTTPRMLPVVCASERERRRPTTGQRREQAGHEAFSWSNSLRSSVFPYAMAAAIAVSSNQAARSGSLAAPIEQLHDVLELLEDDLAIEARGGYRGRGSRGDREFFGSRRRRGGGASALRAAGAALRLALLRDRGRGREAVRRSGPRRSRPRDASWRPRP